MRDLDLLQLLARQEARYRTTLTDMEREVYFDGLGHLDDLTLKAAFARCAQSSPKFFPTVHELLKAVEDMRLASGETMDGDAAWVAFEQRVLRRFAPTTKQHDWPDDATRDIVRNHLGLPVGGVHPLATMENAYERDQYRKRFVKLYDERRLTGQAVAQAETAIDAPNLRRIGAGD